MTPPIVFNNYQKTSWILFMFIDQPLYPKNFSHFHISTTFAYFVFLLISTVINDCYYVTHCLTYDNLNGLANSNMMNWTKPVEGDNSTVSMLHDGSRNHLQVMKKAASSPNCYKTHAGNNTGEIDAVSRVKSPMYNDG